MPEVWRLRWVDPLTGIYQSHYFGGAQSVRNWLMTNRPHAPSVYEKLTARTVANLLNGDFRVEVVAMYDPRPILEEQNVSGDSSTKADAPADAADGGDAAGAAGDSE